MSKLHPGLQQFDKHMLNAGGAGGFTRIVTKQLEAELLAHSQRDLLSKPIPSLPLLTTTC